MNIEIGKIYSVTNKYKKTYVETVELFKENSPSLLHYTVWRAGTWIITPRDEDEVATLIEAQSDDFNETFDFSYFEDAEFDSTWDGCSEDLVSDDDPDFAYEISEKYYDDDELSDNYFSVIEYLEEELRYTAEDFVHTIEGPIVVELVEV